MFAPDLSFHLSLPAEEVGIGAIRAFLPDLEWGDESDLMKHSDEWPAAVVLAKDRVGCEPGERCDFPVVLNFVRFPGRVAGNDGEMAAVKVGLLRRLAAVFECRVLCDAEEFTRQENDAPDEHQGISESFLCQGGRVFSGGVSVYEASEGARPGEGWVALDDLPEVRLSSDGSLADKGRAIARIARWISGRDLSHLLAPSFPVFPDPPSVSPIPLTREEIEAEIAAEFPSDEEIEREEAVWEAYTRKLEAWEHGVGTTSSKQLISSGITLPPPDSLADNDLVGKLREVIDGLSRKNTYLHHTDHLSDRELYAWLWEEGLNESIIDLEDPFEGNIHTSPIGSGDEKSNLVELTYYDNAEDRAEWKADYPGDDIPAHRDPPHDRDRFLPKPLEDLD